MVENSKNTNLRLKSDSSYRDGRGNKIGPMFYSLGAWYQRSGPGDWDESGKYLHGFPQGHHLFEAYDLKEEWTDTTQSSSNEARLSHLLAMVVSCHERGLDLTNVVAVSRVLLAKLGVTPQHVRHRDRETEYVVLGEATFQVSTDTRGQVSKQRVVNDYDPMVVYVSVETHDVWVRPYFEFHDGRFVQLTPKRWSYRE